jgi:F-box interacting protein
MVHVPCSYSRCYDFETVQLLTLGETTWRDVSPPAAGARCRLSAGIISIDGVTHWVKVGGDTRIVSFDLDAECFASTAMSLPRLSAKHGAYHLTEVHGRLGFVSLPDVWVLEKGRRGWSHRYKLQEGIPCPHLVYGDCVLIMRDKLRFYGHWPKSSPSLLWGGVIHIGHKDHGSNVYTIEPLNVYMPPIN